MSCTRGETLYQIAWQHGLDQRDLARWNGISNPDMIRVGQRLRLSPPHGDLDASEERQAARGRPAARKRRGRGGRTSQHGGSPSSKSSAAKPAAEPPLPSLPPPQWAWPADGRVVTRFGSHEGIATGIGIGGHAGEPCARPRRARVVYAGSGLIGYGQLVIIKHNETYFRPTATTASCS